MLELVALIVLILSLCCLGLIILKKVPLLLELPETVPFSFNWQECLKKIKSCCPFNNFSFGIFLQKTLSKIRILTLKTDNKTSNWLQRLREKNQKKKIEQDDDYWQQLRKSARE